MHKIRFGLVLLVGLVAAGCGPGTQQVASTMLGDGSSKGAPPTIDACAADESKNLFFAAPMCSAYTVTSTSGAINAAEADLPINSSIKNAFIADALLDSQTKCDNFIKKVTVGQAGESTVFDLSAIFLSGIGAAISGPASTIRALSASSAAVQGFKATLNSDLFQSMAIASFINEINTTYYAAIDQRFGSSSLNSYTAVDAYRQIREIHRNCSIPAAAANLSTNPSKTTPGASATVTITGSAVAGDTVSLNATSALQNINQSISHQVEPGESLEEIASNLILEILTDLSTSGVSTSGVTPSGTGASAGYQFAVKGGPSDLKWTSTTAATLKEQVKVQ